MNIKITLFCGCTEDWETMVEEGTDIPDVGIALTTFKCPRCEKHVVQETKTLQEEEKE